MPSEVVYREYTNVHRPELTDWMIGNIGEFQTLRLRTRTGSFYAATKTKSLGLEVPNILQANDGSDFYDSGFKEGDSCTMELTYRIVDAQNAVDITFPLMFAFNVLDVIGSTMITDLTLDTSWPQVLPGQRVTQSSTGSSLELYFFEVVIWTDKRPDAVEMFYNQNDNNTTDKASTNSLFDGSRTRLLANDLQALVPLGPVQPFELLGNQSGHGIFAANIEYIGKVGNYIYEHDIRITMLIGQIYTELEQVSDTLPPESMENDNCITDNYSIKFFPTYNDPNVGVSNDMNNSWYLGNTGWFGENFNGNETTMELVAVNYYEQGTFNTVDSLDISQPITVQMTVKGVANISALTTWTMFLQWVTDTEDHTRNNIHPYHHNHFLNAYGQSQTIPCDGVNNPAVVPGFTRDGSNARLDITNMIGDVISVIDGIAQIQFDVVPTAEFAAFMGARQSDDRNYVIGVNIGDESLVTNFSDRVVFKEYNQFTITVPDAGPHSPLSINYGNHPNEDTEYDLNPQILVEDEMLMTGLFSIDPVVNGKLLNIQCIFEAYNSLDDDKFFALDEVAFDTSNALVNGVIQEINQFSTRGYQMVAGLNKNFLNLFRNSAGDGGGLYAYKLQVGWQPRREDWIDNPNVDPDFYDTNEPQDGLNQNWRRFDNGVDWFLRTKILMLWERPDGTTETTTNTRTFSIKDFDESTEYQGELKLYEDEALTLPVPQSIDPSTGEEIYAIEDGEIYVALFDFTRFDAGPLDVTDHFGVMRFQEENGPGQMSIKRLSSKWGSEPNNPLIPLSTETRLKVEQVSPTVGRIIGKLDTNKFDTTKPRWWVSGRIGFYCNVTEDDLAWIDNQWTQFKTANPHFLLDDPETVLFSYDKGGGNIFEIRNTDIENFFFEHFAPCSYYVETFGPSGLNKGKADWFQMYFFHNDWIGNSIVDPTGDMAWNLEGQYYFGNNVFGHTWTGVGIGIVSSESDFANTTVWNLASANLFGIPSIFYADDVDTLNLSTSSGDNDLDDFLMRPSNHEMTNFNIRGNNLNGVDYDLNAYRPNAHGNIQIAVGQVNTITFPTNVIANDTTYIDIQANNAYDNTAVVDLTGLTLNQTQIYALYSNYAGFNWPANSKLRLFRLAFHSNPVPFAIDWTNVEFDGTLSPSFAEFRTNAVNNVILNPAKQYVFDSISFFAVPMPSFNSVSVGTWDFDASPILMKDGCFIDVQQVGNCTQIVPPRNTDNVSRIRLLASSNCVDCDLSTMTANQNGIWLDWRNSGIALDNSPGGLQKVAVDQIWAQGWTDGILDISTFAGLSIPDAATQLVINDLVNLRNWTITQDTNYGRR
jgi:hypothetical protein